MANGVKSSNWQDVWPQALALAWENESFRQALLEDAGAAIKAYLNVELPETLPGPMVASSDALPRYAREMPANAEPPCFC